jgi:hypothetical protein
MRKLSLALSVAILLTSVLVLSPNAIAIDTDAGKKEARGRIRALVDASKDKVYWETSRIWGNVGWGQLISSDHFGNALAKSMRKRGWKITELKLKDVITAIFQELT